MKINETFVSIQGEGTRTGELCAFFRLYGCSFGCFYCDTHYAKEGDEYQEFSIDELVQKAKDFSVNLVMITGGEPLEQTVDTPIFAQKLIDSGFTVLVETNGAHDISVLPKEVIKIVDVKLPWVGQKEHFYYNNLAYLTQDDELKFVIDTKVGYNWAKTFIATHAEKIPCKITFSPCAINMEPKTLAEMIIKDKLHIRFGMQMHKVLWKNRRGV